MVVDVNECDVESLDRSPSKTSTNHHFESKQSKTLTDKTGKSLGTTTEKNQFNHG